MNLRGILFIFIVLLLTFNTFAYDEYGFLALSGEPTVRIGLSTNAGSVSITTTDTQLVAASPDEPNKLLAVNKISVTARAYRPPEIDIYNFEIQNIENSAEAANLTTDIIQNTGEKAVASIDPVTGKWRVRVGEAKETLEEANVFKAEMMEKGFADLVIVTDKKVQPSDDALLLSQQLKTAVNPRSVVLLGPTARPCRLRRTPSVQTCAR